MDIFNAIRSGIFFVAGLLFILFPKKVYKFQVYLIEKLRIKYNIKRDGEYYSYVGVIFIIISIILFVFSIAN